MKTFFTTLIISLAFLNLNAQCPAAADAACADNSNAACPEIYTAIIESIVPVDATISTVEISMDWTRCSAANASIEYILMAGDPADFNEDEFDNATCFGPIVVNDDCGVITLIQNVNTNDVNDLYVAARGRTNGSCGGTTCDFVIVLASPRVLPVKLTNFEGNQVNDYVLLEWTTETEVQNEGFIIEKSSDANDFKEISFVEGSGTTTEKTAYNFREAFSYSTSYYRLKQIDYDGGYAYSEVITVKARQNENALEFNIYPNPVKSDLITIELMDGNETTCEVFNNHGRKMFSEIITQDRIEISTSEWASGIYSVSIYTNQQVQTKRLIKI